jgi:hypothetical protein
MLLYYYISLSTYINYIDYLKIFENYINYYINMCHLHLQQ